MGGHVAHEEDHISVGRTDLLEKPVSDALGNRFAVGTAVYEPQAERAGFPVDEA